MVLAKGKKTGANFVFCAHTAALFDSHTSLEQHTNHVLSAFLKVGGFKLGAVYSLQESGEYKVTAAEGNLPTDFIETFKQAYTNSEMLNRTDICAFGIEHFQKVKLPKIKSLIIVPLIIFDEYSGFVVLFSPKDQAETEVLKGMYPNFSVIVSSALQKRETENRLSKASNDMRNFITVAKAQSQLALMRLEPPIDTKAEKNLRSLRFVIEQMDLLTRYIDEKIKAIRNG